MAKKQNKKEKSEILEKIKEKILPKVKELAEFIEAINTIDIRGEIIEEVPEELNEQEIEEFEGQPEEKAWDVPEDTQEETPEENPEDIPEKFTEGDDGENPNEFGEKENTVTEIDEDVAEMAGLTKCGKENGVNVYLGSDEQWLTAEIIQRVKNDYKMKSIRAK